MIYCSIVYYGLLYDTVLCDAALITRLHISGVGAAVLIAMLCYARYCAELTAR